MGYEVAFQIAWDNLQATAKEDQIKVRFLSDTYEVDRAQRKVFSLSCNILAPDHVSLLILHYLFQKLKGLPKLAGEWISFNQLPGGQGYYAAFRKRALEPIIRKYGQNPSGLLACLERLPAKKIQHGDYALVLEAFENLPVMIALWAQDEEFGAEANMLFDQSILKILTTEDVAVLAGIVAKAV